MPPQDKKFLSKKISLVIAKALESGKISLKKAGDLAQSCVKYLDTVYSAAEFKTVINNENDPELKPLIYEIIGNIKN